MKPAEWQYARLRSISIAFGLSADPAVSSDFGILTKAPPIHRSNQAASGPSWTEPGQSAYAVRGKSREQIHVLKETTKTTTITFTAGSAATSNGPYCTFNFNKFIIYSNPFNKLVHKQVTVTVATRTTTARICSPISPARTVTVSTPPTHELAASCTQPRRVQSQQRNIP